MTVKRIVAVLLAALALALLILLIEINIDNNANLTKSQLNEVILWSFIKGLVISVAVSIGNHYRSLEKNRNN